VSSQFRYLFSPLKIGLTTVRNRISFSARLTRFAENWLPTERNAAYLGERAKGGCGLTITEEQSVHPTDRVYDRMIDTFEPAVVPGYRQITSAVHHYGGRIPDVLFRETPKIAEAEDLDLLCLDPTPAPAESVIAAVAIAAATAPIEILALAPQAPAPPLRRHRPRVLPPIIPRQDLPADQRIWSMFWGGEARREGAVYTLPPEETARRILDLLDQRGLLV
jgi:NADH:flavin oxidoreductase / NADH oxidase family